MDDELIALMRTKLPQYVVECFLVAGFDTIEVIIQMNISDGPYNSLDQIESFVLKNFPDNPLDYHVSSITPSVPGHRIRITQFINEIKASDKKARKRKLISQESSVATKKPKLNDQVISCSRKK